MDEPVSEPNSTKAPNIYRFLLLSVLLSILLGTIFTVTFEKLAQWSDPWEMVPTVPNSAAIFKGWLPNFIYWFSCFILAAATNSCINKPNSSFSKNRRWVRNFVLFFFAGGLLGVLSLAWSLIASPLVGHDIANIVVSEFYIFGIVVFVFGLITACVGVVVAPLTGLK